jgi:signal transduction histidine kinase
MLIVEDNVLGDKTQLKKLRIAVNMIEWYIHVIYKQRMISELHHQTQKSSYEELVVEHQRVLESEKKYRELAETLEQRVQERKEELEKAQRQLIQQEKLASIGQLAAGVAHEINNPTSFVNSNLQTLKKYHCNIVEVLNFSRGISESNESPESKEFLDMWKRLDMDYLLEDLSTLVDESLKGTDRIIRIVSGLSRFSHVDQEEWGWIGVHELMDSAVELLWNEIKHKVELIKDYGDLPKIRGNPNQLGQVFVNLILNALQAMEKRGKLTLVTRPGDFDIEIQIKDNGKGISPENLSKIFNPFFTTKPAGQGTGLGLSISYEIIAGHEGDIQVESEPGKGTTFYVRLPIDPGKED